MPEISIDRAVLRRILLQLFGLEASESARITLLNRPRFGHPEDSERAAQLLWLVRQVAGAHAQESQRQREQTRNLEKSLLESLAGSDDDAFRASLYQIFPPQMHPEEGAPTTREQGRSGLGLAAQGNYIEAFGMREGFSV